MTVPPKNPNAQLPSDERSPRHVNAAYGPPELCAWQVEPCVFWIQTTEPQFSRKLETRKDMRRVEMTGVTHFRRTFETRGRLRKLRRLIDRFLVSAGGHFSANLRPQNASKNQRSVRVPVRSSRRNKADFLAGGAQ
jgi:hypothetical protein